MNFFTRRDRGLFELLMILPLFLGLLCVILWIGFIIIMKSRMEKHAWVLQTKLTYGQNIHPSQLNSNYRMDHNLSFGQLTQIGSLFKGQLPNSFKIFSTPTKYKTLNLQGTSSKTSQDLWNASFKEHHENILPYSLQSHLIIPGSPLHHNRLLKFGLWQEAMASSGFGMTYPLYMLGIPELKRATISESNVGGFAQWMKMTSSEIKERITQ